MQQHPTERGNQLWMRRRCAVPSASCVLALIAERGSDPHPRRGSHCDSALIIALPQLQLEELIACYFWKLLTAAPGCKSSAGLMADEFIHLGWIHSDCQDQIWQPRWWLMQLQRCSEMWIMKRKRSWKIWRGEDTDRIFESKYNFHQHLSGEGNLDCYIWFTGELSTGSERMEQKRRQKQPDPVFTSRMWEICSLYGKVAVQKREILKKLNIERRLTWLTKPL